MDIRQYEASVHYLGIEANVYLAKDVDEYFAKMTKNNCDYAKKILEGVIELKDENEKLKAENAELKQKLEDAKASHYAEMVDAGMRERKLKRAFYKACANWAHHRVFVRFNSNEKAWENVERKCRAKAEQYK